MHIKYLESDYGWPFANILRAFLIDWMLVDIAFNI